MEFLVGAFVGLGVFLVISAVRDPRPFHIASRRRMWFKRVALPSIGAGILGFLIGLILTGTPIIAASIAILAGCVPVGWRDSQDRRRAEALREAWPEVLDEVVNSLRAGLSVSDAMAAVSLRGPAIMREPFTQFADHVRASGRLGSALDELKRTLHDPMADRIIESMRIAADLGGHDLSTMLSSLATLVREDNRARGDLLARQSWTVNGARLAAVAPWLMLALFASRPGTLEAFQTPVGIVVICIGLVLTVVAYVLMIRLGRLPEPERIFVGEAHA